MTNNVKGETRALVAGVGLMRRVSERERRKRDHTYGTCVCASGIGRRPMQCALGDEAILHFLEGD